MLFSDPSQLPLTRWIRQSTPEDREGPVGTAIVRELNARTVLARLRHDGQMSRAELARRSGLSKPTISTTLAELETDGLVRESGSHEGGRRGPQSVLYESDPSAGYVVGIDVGRRFLRIALADLSGTVLLEQSRPNRMKSATAIVAEIAKATTGLLTQRRLDRSALLAATVASPGIFDPATGRLRWAPHVPGGHRSAIREELRRALALPVEIENDINLGALGELHYGAAKEASTFAFLSIGTGVGMGIVIDRQLYRGAFGGAGEIGFLPDPLATKLPTGTHDGSRDGALESAASGDAILAEAQRSGLGVSSAEEVFELAASGNRRAQKVATHLAERIGVVIATVAAILDPEFIVVGGGVGQNAPMLEGTITKIRDSLVPMRTPLIASELPTSAVVLGAVASSLAAARERAFAERQSATR